MINNEYEVISKYYYGKVTSENVPYINHIDEGLDILGYIDASELTQAAFCLHPIFQSNNDWSENQYNEIDLSLCNPWAIALAVEYRNVANFYLSKTGYDSKIIHLLNQARPEIKDMLIADKIQNYKDMFKYNRHRANFNLLEDYFQKWFNILNIDENRKGELIGVIT